MRKGGPLIALVLGWVLGGALAIQTVAVAAAAVAPEVRLEPPRVHGWWIGDVLTARAWITVDGDSVPSPASLPLPGSVTYWLTLRSAHVTRMGKDGGRTRYRVDLAYQTFYAPLEPKRMTVPALPLVFSGEGGPVPVVIPSWTFVTSPLREILAASKPTAMAPAPPFVSIDPMPLAVRAGAAGGLGLVALLLLAWRRAAWPFTRRSRPFGRAARALAKGRTSRWRREPPITPQAACVLLHRAFDDALGRRMLGDDIPAFLHANPGFAALERDIRAFHMASRALIFGDRRVETDSLVSERGLRRFAQSLAVAERRRL